MKKITFILCLMLSFALFGEDDFEESSEGRLYIVGFSSTLDFYQMDEGRWGLAPTSWSQLGLLSGNFSTALAFDLSQLFESHSLDVNDDFDWERFVMEANVQIQNIGGEPVAVVVGKQAIPFGQGQTRQPLPLFWDNLAEVMQEIQGVMGVSVEISELSRFQELVDKVEFSVFESSTEWDFDIRGRPAYSVRLTKLIETEEWEHTITASYVRLDNGPLKEGLSSAINGDEERISLGFVTDSAFSEDLLLWGEAIYFRNNFLFRSPSYRMMLAAGGLFQATDTVFLGGEFNAMEGRHKSYSGALWYRPISKQGYQLSFGLEYRYTDFEDKLAREDEQMVGLVMRVQLYGAEGFRF